MPEKLYYYENNGVTAVITQSTLDEGEPFMEVTRRWGDWSAWFYTKPIFTFSDAPGLQGVVTGTIADMEELTRGFSMERFSIYVPFSNCYGDLSSIYAEAAEDGVEVTDLKYLTTLRQVMDAFGLKPVREEG
ncbi:MAG: hypothetical protein A3A57_02520 [Candidatus Woykebacteria bacterium RIFCSPLOWO2_01_FULL_41_12]|uniref:Uncharacterized protein n=1 Tax=Candidatus Woykebacteria bacterium RIFCSPLOWO2_01_FULL_41_12 TaxID=1802604 RepID=A0A1G1WVF1_9BACT|nr:MAG: hypothetical protein A3A57_02520 [Candidatus Woykebacteria bacterium RIFCSPLOWO2_01_FULL_41_12]